MQKKSICILSLSPIADDPRVRRQGQAFYDAGWEVIAIGIGAARSNPPAWPIIRADTDLAHVDDDQRQIAGLAQRIVSAIKARFPASTKRFVREALQCLEAAFKRKSKGSQIVSNSDLPYTPKSGSSLDEYDDLPAPLDPDVAEEGYLKVAEIHRMYAAAKNICADVYLANDWHMLPVARKLASEHVGLYGYDTHEYAVEEYRYKPGFRESMIPLVRGIEGRGLTDACVTTAVSAGIAQDIARLYKLTRVPTEIRNVPNHHQNVELRKTDPSRIVVYFHGIITFDRGLEDCIRSVPYWRPEFIFKLRGPVRPEFQSTLDLVIKEADVANRVEILPEVAMTDLVSAASIGDIGISTPPATSKHNIYALPNKFFEYIQAGLALCIPEIPDMANIVRKHDLGVMMDDVSPRSIAEAINQFRPESIDHFKANSLVAANTLNWETEQSKLVTAYEGAIAKP